MSAKKEVDWEVFQVLPFLLDVLDSIRENESAKMKNNQYESTQPSKNLVKTVSLLLNRIETCKNTLEQLPGTEYTKHEKEELYEDLRRKHEEKCKILAKYKTLPVFE